MLIFPLREPDRNPPNPTRHQLEDYYTNYASACARPYYIALAAIMAVIFTLFCIFTP
ncbi:hypothetical protein [Pseudovibrio ascidiaceicola]|jgi:hypothetical protein|uniref:hypothetical protein n=1 Tax=Pseudovibrio ascidiaceicola TaxID=285279 RepID=UPI000ACF6FA4|nr:hypothetical protein [Pseudovibrio ascidiaceicola]